MSLLPVEESWRYFPHTFAQVASNGRWKPYDYLAEISKAITRAIYAGKGRIVVSLPPRHGKALALNTPIPTPTGWTTMGELKVGDLVFDDRGQPCLVLAKSSVWKDRQVYRVCTDDGDEIVADGEHEWMVRLCRKQQRFLCKTTRYLAERKSPRKPMVQATVPLMLPERELPIGPYTLGIWLGDGAVNQATICKSNDDLVHIRARIEAEGYETSDRATDMTCGVLRLKTVLREHDLLGNKHVPLIYLRASERQRRALLQGLIDTDGYIARDGQVEFCSMDEGLANSVRELVVSLGGKASLCIGRAVFNGKDYGTKYRVLFYLENAASLPRKAQHGRRSLRQDRRYIDFEPCGVADTACIQVDSPSSMFLCGRSMLPTHNSELISKWLPIWFLANHPSKRVMLASYEADFAASWGRKVRDFFEHPDAERFTTVRVKGDSHAADRWETRFDGGMQTAGVGGSFTGKGGDLLIIDDPIKNWVEASSPGRRRLIREWFLSTFFTRAEPGATIVVLMTRWHEHDLVGYLTKEHADNWHEIKLQATSEGNGKGMALCPERYTVEDLQAIKASLGSLMYGALFDQNPTPPEGGIFKRHWFKTWLPGQLPERFDEVIQSWDLPFGKKEGKDDDTSFASGQVWGKKGAAYYLLDEFHDRVDMPAAKIAIKALTERNPLARTKIIENKAMGQPIIAELRTTVPGLVPFNPQGSKEARAIAVSGCVEAGNVYLPSPAACPWVRDYIEEVCTFPKSAFKDRVDSMVQALIRFTAGRATANVGFGSITRISPTKGV